MAGFLRLSVVQRVEPPDLPAVTGRADGTDIVKGRQAQLPAGMLVTALVDNAALAVIVKPRHDGEQTLAAPVAHQLAGAHRPTERCPYSVGAGLWLGGGAPSHAQSPTMRNKDALDRTRTMRASRKPDDKDQGTLAELMFGRKTHT